MATIDKNKVLEFEILKHVESSPRLNNRMIASKLGCSVKLAHALLGKMVDRGFLHVKKLHARRWDYFLTPNGISEKARLTYEFLEFSMNFYREARKASSAVCRALAETGKEKIAFLGTSDLAEIVYLGVKEWGLTLHEVYDDNGGDEFFGHPVARLRDLRDTASDAVIVCLYDKAVPMSSTRYLPKGVERMANMHWIFDAPLWRSGEKPAELEAAAYGVDLSLLRVNLKKTPKQRISDMNSMVNGVDKIRGAMKQHVS